MVAPMLSTHRTLVAPHQYVWVDYKFDISVSNNEFSMRVIYVNMIVILVPRFGICALTIYGEG